MAEQTNKEQELLQQRYMELQMIDAQIKQIQKQIQLIDNQVNELNFMQESIEEIKNVEPGTEILVPLSSGIFLKAELKDVNTALVNVGSGVTVEKTMEQTKALLAAQQNELLSYQQDLDATLAELSVRAGSIEEELKVLVEGRQ